MTGTQNLTRFLDTDPRDVGCDATFDQLDAYAERMLGPGDARARYPGVAVHLSVCPPCLEDLEGLLAMAGDPRSRR